LCVAKQGEISNIMREEYKIIDEEKSIKVIHSNLYGSSSSSKMTGTTYTIIVLHSVKMGRILLK
jgi:hypothetical protein